MAGDLTVHRPVLLDETLAALAVRADGSYIDANLGGGGHAEQILDASAPAGRLLGIDADPAAIERTRARLARFGTRLQTHQGSNAEIALAAGAAGIAAADGILFDLGLSSDQLSDSARGFGIRAGGPLDLRFDTSCGEPASALLARLDARELTRIFKAYGEEPHASRIAKAIVARRNVEPIDTSERLAALVESAVPVRYGPPLRIHPATRVFQALRIAVNDELEALATALDGAISILADGGRIVVLTYHSLEDRIVKQAFAAAARGCICPPRAPACGCGRTPTLRLINRKPLIATDEEIAANPRSRSAKLRAAERIGVAA
ncbi:MAG: 16S rRNA (cytosine(1402)-N(4))-methyltransferase RsmH [Chloroflexi bacterium]|nr:MAG: 16S rRNA (cytosine(1402)-N(4))-methyltransferase RsmH [Chloroflexota bacterium]